MKTSKFLGAVVPVSFILSSGVALAEGASPWLPAPGQVVLGLSYTSQSADTAYIGEQELSISAITAGENSTDEYLIDTTNVRLNYGISDSLSLDVALAYTEVDADPFASDSGLADSIIGLNWQVVDEHLTTYLPTLTLNTALIIAGDYEADLFAALGRGANGLEVSAIFGKQFSSVVSAWGEIGRQSFEEPVPDTMFYNANLGFTLSPQFSASLGYSFKDAVGTDLDIMGPGFSAARFPEIDEERSTIKAGINYAISGNQGLSFNYSVTEGGRNIVRNDNAWAIGYSFGIN